MLIGIPGCGKTTWINKNVNRDQYTIVCPDLIRKELTGTISDLTQDKKVWELAKERVLQYLILSKNVILDATNVNMYYRQNFIKGLPPCQLKAKLFHISSEEAKERVKKDIEKGIDRSHVPDNVVDMMYRQFISQCTPEQLNKEGFEILED